MRRDPTLEALCVAATLLGACAEESVTLDADGGVDGGPSLAGGAPSKPPRGAPPPPSGEAPIPPDDDPCAGIDAAGTCKGDVALRCEGGRLAQVACADLGLACGFDEALGRNACVPRAGDPPDAPDAPEPGDDAPDAPDVPEPDAPPEEPEPPPGAPEPPPDEPAPPPDDPGAPEPPGSPEPPPPDVPPDAPEPPPPDVPPDAPDVPPDEPDPPADDPCGGIDYLGVCDGAVAVWCDEGRLHRVDCTVHGQGCGWVDGNTGFYCGGQGEPPPGPDVPDDPGEPEDPGGPDVPVAPDAPDDPGAPPPPDEGAPDPDPPGGCGDLDHLGLCEGPVAVWCDGDVRRRVDCSEFGQTCGFVDALTGHFCVDR